MEAKQEKIVESLGPSMFFIFLKQYLTWIDVDNKVGEVCRDIVKQSQEEGMTYPKGNICFIEH